jgi:hypothetical protein
MSGQEGLILLDAIEINSIRFNRVVYSDFDAHGNWLKSITYKRIEKDGKISYEPVEAEYRTIRYHWAKTAIERIETWVH